MPDSDSTSPSHPESAPFEPRLLPVPVTPARENGGNWIVRTFRALFGIRPSTIRADLKDVLDAMTPGESGFSPEESRMLRNILGLRERRVGDVMVPRADIVAVQQDIQIGELLMVFEKAGHSRLVAYNDTLDDPVGMVHIRDLIAYMTAHAAVDPEKNARRKKPLPAGLDLKAIDLAMSLSLAKIEDVAGIVGHDFDVGDAAEEVDTLGGYLVTRAGRLPLRGELIPGPGLFEFEVLDADPRRIKRVRISRLAEKRQKPREQPGREPGRDTVRKRGEPDAVLAGTAPPTLNLDETPISPDASSSRARRP